MKEAMNSLNSSSSASGVYPIGEVIIMFIAFPLHDGSYDYTGFYSRSPKAVKYCGDLFDYYWSRTNIISGAEIVDRHMKYLEHFGLNPRK
jgi:predicted transcriptional regulator